MKTQKLWVWCGLLFSAVFLIVTTSPVSSVNSAKAPDVSEVFKGYEAAFVLNDLKNNESIRYNEERCQQRLSPFSTFKIPNSLIGLERGAVKNADSVIPWDREKNPPETLLTEEWGRDHNLRSAIKYSVVWYYQEIARRVGEPVMRKYVSAFRYGNEDISGGIDQFWLNSSLKISADEQIEFLKKFYKNELPVSKRSAEIVKDILLQEETNSYKLRGKTGSGYLGKDRMLGWFVGYLEKADNVYFFATNLEGKSFEDVGKQRVELTKQALKKLGLL